MKLLFCEACGELVVPGSNARWCGCGRHAVWWVDPLRGILRVYDGVREGARTADPPYEVDPKAFVIGIMNGFLRHPKPYLTKEDYVELWKNAEEAYLFSRVESVAVRIRPGASDDTAYATQEEYVEAM